MNRQALKEELGGELSLPSLPEVVVQLLEMIGDPTCGMKDLGEVMVGDPPLTARVLRVVNSALYSLSRPVSDIRHAAAILGLDSLHSLLLEIGVLEMVKKLKPVKGFDPRELWKHSVLTARLAASFPERLMHVNSKAEVQTCALLHDIGQFILFEKRGHEYLELVRSAREAGRPLHEQEREAFGYDHTEVGVVAAERWGLPPVVIRTIGNHHLAPEALADEPDVVAVVALADKLARRAVAAKGVRFFKPLPESLVDGLVLDEAEVEGLMELSFKLRRKAA